MEINKIKKLIALLEESSLSELEIKEGDDSVRLVRYSPNPSHPINIAAGIATNLTPPPPEIDHNQALQTLPKYIEIKAPMVGTFYRSPQPDTPPFINPGQLVSQGEIFCIIEAMKMFNQIELECDGIVEKILVEDGQPIEYGQTLILLSPRPSML